MRPKFVAVILLLMFALLVTLALVRRGLHLRPITHAAETIDGLTPEQGPGGARASKELAKSSNTGRMESLVAQPSSEDAEATHEEYVLQRIEELDKLAKEKGADALNAILLELENPDQQIRKGALDAAIEFRDRSSIPRLQQIAGSTQDPNEKAEILEAIEYLKLPTLTEYRAELQANAANAKPADNSTLISNRWSRIPKAQTQGLPTKP